MNRHPLWPFFDPASVAIIGASTDPDKLGGRPIRFLREAGYAGQIYPINPKVGEVQGLKAYAALADVPGPVDHALIIVPAAAAGQALRDCIAKGVRHVQVLSSGFAEEDEAGRQRQAALLALAREHGVRLLGPNCLGIVSVRNHFHATFSTALEALSPRPGGISFATQSGAFGSCAYAQAIQRGLGIARIVATGNEADVDVAQAIDFLAEDEQTRVICAAIEGCRDGDVLRGALRKAAAAGKPVILMKVGASSRGQLAAATHTGAIAGDDRVFDTVVRECGAWRAATIEQMLDIAYLCTQFSMPANAQAGVLTVSGGIGVLMADDAERHGVELPPIPAELAASLRVQVPFAIGDNPLDTTAQIGAVKDGIAGLAGLLLRGTAWSTLCLYLAQIPCDERRFAPILAALAALRREHPGRLIVLVGPHSEPAREQVEAAGLAIFADPGRAMAAVGALCGLAGRWRAPRGPAPSARPPALPLPGGRFDELRAKQVLAHYGLPILPERLCATPAEAVAAAREIGFPVVAKIASPDIAHKTEIGGVMFGLADAAAVERAHDALLSRARQHAPGARISGVLVAPMSRPGTETILGVHIDPLFGPMVMFGLGGVAVELFQDVAFASAPLDEAGAEALIGAVRASRLLKGWRGQPALDTAVLRQALIGLSYLAVDWRAALQGIDVNPFVIRPDGAVCLDALITLNETAD